MRRHGVLRQTAICQTPLPATWKPRLLPIRTHNQRQPQATIDLYHSTALDRLVLQMLQVHRMRAAHQPQLRQGKPLLKHLLPSNESHEQRKILFLQIVTRPSTSQRPVNLDLIKAYQSRRRRNQSWNLPLKVPRFARRTQPNLPLLAPSNFSHNFQVQQTHLRIPNLKPAPFPKMDSREIQVCMRAPKPLTIRRF